MRPTFGARTTEIALMDRHPRSESRASRLVGTRQRCVGRIRMFTRIVPSGRCADGHARNSLMSQNAGVTQRRIIHLSLDHDRNSSHAAAHER